MHVPALSPHKEQEITSGGLTPMFGWQLFLICPLWVGSLPTPMAFALADIHALGDESDHPTYI